MTSVVYILASGGQGGLTERCDWQIDYADDETVGITVTGNGSMALTLLVSDAGFSYGPISLDPYMNVGRVALPSSNPVHIPIGLMPSPPGPKEPWPWTVNQSWQA